jgi:hypothetical protein
LVCENDLYFVTIEAHIEENPKFHKLSPQKKQISKRKIKTYYLFGIEFNISLFSKWSQTLYDSCKCSIKPSFSYVKSYKELGSLRLEFHIVLHIIWMPNRDYMFYSFFLCCIYVWEYLYPKFQYTCFLEIIYNYIIGYFHK